jgi:hypothetical protein
MKVAGDSTALFDSFAVLQGTMKLSMLNWGKGVLYLYNKWSFMVFQV